jgi:hypothetical protein
MAANMVYLAIIGMSNYGNDYMPRLIEVRRSRRGGEVLSSATRRSA